MVDCCSHNQSMNAYFDDERVRQDVTRYLKHGPDKHTRAMADAVTACGVQGATVLEVGGGIGALYTELLKRGATSAVNVDIAEAYLTTAQSLADQLGLNTRVQYDRADFACEADNILPADIVIMHRVICCYPDMPRLVSAAAQHTHRILALSFPRDAWYVRLFIEAQARWFQMKGLKFHNYVHPSEDIFLVAASSGLKPVHQSFSGTWHIVVFERTP
jgi:2-polyprenyl-3-methyl-5-hydroxy-6-metoxy-1,4-benzoquinol methylase